MTVRFLTSVAALAVAPMVCHAEVFLSLEQAQRLIFPGESLSDASLTLNDPQKRLVELGTGAKLKERQIKAWRAEGGGVLFLDTVIGKHERITYACGISPSGQVKQIEVMEYREAYGHQVRNASWRQQFTGKSLSSDLNAGGEIRHISGATFSSRNITAGVKRLLHVHAAAFSNSPSVNPPSSTVC